MNRYRLGITAVVIAMIAAPCFGGSSSDIEQAIDKAKAYLIHQQNKEGNWEIDPKIARGNEKPDINNRFEPGDLTSLAVYALVSNYQDWRGEDMTRAVAFVSHAELSSVRSLGIASQMSLFVLGKKQHDWVEPNSAKLIAGLAQPAVKVAEKPDVWGPGIGFYGDRMNSQYGVLGMSSLVEEGAEVPTSYWKLVDAAWKKAQLKNGGWSANSADTTPTIAMTAAGVSTLLITSEYQPPRNWANCTGSIPDEQIERGLQWLDQHFDDALADPETMWTIQRIAGATGRTHFSGKDLYEVLVDHLIKRQMPDGSFAGPDSAVANTSFALLVLSSARRPVMMSKVRYVTADHAANFADSWNERPRDVGHLARWAAIEIQTEGFNWNVVDLSEAQERLHDAPILFIGGSQALNFTKEQEDKLRSYVEQGGVILGNADCGGDVFSKSFMSLGRKLFPKYEFREAGSDDLVFHEMFRDFRRSGKPRVMELGNGVRKLMLLIPDADLSRRWQTRSTGTHEDAFGLAMNIFLYAIDKNHVVTRGESYLVASDPQIHAKRSVKLGRLDLGDNSDPEPAGWQRMAAIMHNSHDLDLTVDHISTAQLSDYKVAHLTGTGKLNLSADARTSIQNFVGKGGTLIVDAAGGDVDFADSFQAEAAAMFPDNAIELLPPDDVIYHYPGCKIERIRWRVAAQDRVSNAHAGALQGIKFGNRIGVYFSRHDLSCGLVGQPVDGIYGYDPATATTLMSAMLLSAADH